MDRNIHELAEREVKVSNSLSNGKGAGASRSRWGCIVVGVCLLVLLPGQASAALLRGGSVSTGVQLPQNGAVITYGATEGEVAGDCTRGPGLAPAFFVAIYHDGRVVASHMEPVYPIKHLSAADVRTLTSRLIQRARRDHFFHIPSYMRDTTCSAAYTAYIRIRWHGMVHTVEILGYRDNLHPQFTDLYRALSVIT